MDMAEIVEINISKKFLKKAEEIHSKLSEKYKEGFNKHSYRKGSCLLDSILSELVVANHLKLERVDTFDYDFISSKGSKIDLKTKPQSDYFPQENWYAMVPAYQLEKQDCEYYIFNRINKSLTKLWIVGYISKSNFKKKSHFVKKGEVDPDSSPSKPWICPEDSYYIKIKNLKAIK